MPLKSPHPQQSHCLQMKKLTPYLILEFTQKCRKFQFFYTIITKLIKIFIIFFGLHLEEKIEVYFLGIFFTIFKFENKWIKIQFRK